MHNLAVGYSKFWETKKEDHLRLVFMRKLENDLSHQMGCVHILSMLTSKTGNHVL